MTTFDKREEGFEKKFALDEEQKFKAEARRNKLLGLWVAEKLGMSGDAASAYAKEVVAADFEAAGDGDVVRKVTARSRRQGRRHHRKRSSRAKMDELMAQAIAAGEGREVRRRTLSGWRKPASRREASHREVSGCTTADTGAGAPVAHLRMSSRAFAQCDAHRPHPSLKPYSGTLPLAP